VNAWNARGSSARTVVLREVADEVVHTHDGWVGLDGPFRPDRPVQAAEGARVLWCGSSAGAAGPLLVDLECSLGGTLPLGVPIPEIRPI
jgi:hypothetical protein